jgi:cystathionine beta-lyase
VLSHIFRVTRALITTESMGVCVAVRDALRTFVDSNIWGYSRRPDSLNQKICAYLKQMHDLDVHPSWLVQVPAVVESMTLALGCVGEPGDDVMVATPVYYPFLTVMEHTRKRLNAVPLTYESKTRTWSFDFAAMERAVTPRTRAFLLCSPHNPVGRVFSFAELEQLCEFCARHSLLLISDEIHCDLVLDPQSSHVPTLSLLQPGPNNGTRGTCVPARSRCHALSCLA